MSTLNRDDNWGPRVALGAPDMAVYTKNRNLRVLGCRKLGAPVAAVKRCVANVITRFCMLHPLQLAERSHRALQLADAC